MGDGGQISGNTVVWNLGTLAAGASKDLTVTLTAGDDSVVATAGPVTVSAGSEVVAVSPNVDTSSFTQHHVRIIGP